MTLKTDKTDNTVRSGGSTAAGTSSAAPRLVAGLWTVVLRLAVPVLIVIAWWAVSQTEITGLFVPTPAEAVQTFWDEFVVGDAVVTHTVPSLVRALVGLGVAIVVGIAVGVALGTSTILTGLFQPLVHLGRSLPSPALLGVFFLLFGVGDAPKIFLIAFAVVWPILLNTIDGVGAVGEVRAQAAQVFRIPAHRVLTMIVLPGAAPKIFAGIRTSMSYSLIMMIISELQRSENGLGYLLVQAQRNFDFGTFFAVLIMLVIIGVVFNLVFKAIERRVLAWHRGVTDQHD
ncbi:ABC transporter permease [Corynebacterium kalidii]|uniref:ABC transporter permease n=1 Tax=Corynebacterium kalidii TaxID=2931982 RepID=A0A9X1WGP7_9CORY|nr:ABC transporter permease [Corynebacterium kalidii]MCJ7858769.1 ABC transporter permease [Corynebacterium kalidii]